VEGELLTYGPLGIFAAILVVLSRYFIVMVIADRDRERGRNEQLVNVVLGDVTPALIAATKAIEARSDHERKVLDVLIECAEVLSDVRERLA
jgi:hypothetical protein